MGEDAEEMFDMGDKTIEWLMELIPSADPVNVIGVCLVIPTDSAVTTAAVVGVIC